MKKLIFTSLFIFIFSIYPYHDKDRTISRAWRPLIESLLSNSTLALAQEPSKLAMRVFYRISDKRIVWTHEVIGSYEFPTTVEEGLKKITQRFGGNINDYNYIVIKDESVIEYKFAKRQFIENGKVKIEKYTQTELDAQTNVIETERKIKREMEIITREQAIERLKSRGEIK